MLEYRADEVYRLPVVVRDHLLRSQNVCYYTISRYGILRERAVKGNLPWQRSADGIRVRRVRPRAKRRQPGLPLERIKLPPGFEISVSPTALRRRARSRCGKGNVLFRRNARRSRVRRALSEAKAVQVITLASDLRIPNGWRCATGALYVAEVNRILRFDDIEARLDARPKPRSSPTAFPANAPTARSYIRFGPDGRLVRAGRRAVLHLRSGSRALRAHFPDPSPTGRATRCFARGVRNSVGFDWDPRTPRNCGHRATAATCSATTCPRTS